MIRILALEDEAVFANLITLIVGRLGYELMGIADNGEEMLRLIRATSPDIVLLDIQVNGNKDGIDIAGEIQKMPQPVPVIFITSHNEQEFFLRAKQTNPYAYVTKPFDEGTLERAIELTILQSVKIAEIKDQQTWGQDVLLSDSFFIKIGDRLEKIKIADILYIEVELKYVTLYTQKKQVAARMTLQEILEKLPASEFIQIHRKHIINIQYLENINLKNAEVEIAGKKLSISKRQKEQVIEKLNKLV